MIGYAAVSSMRAAARWVCLAALFALVPMRAGGAEPLAFKSLRIGEPTSAEVIQAVVPAKCNPPVRGVVSCNGSTTIGGVRAQINIMISGGILDRVYLSFPSSAFETIAEGLLEKYGKPPIDEQPTMQTGAGAVVRNRSLTWIDASGNRLGVTRYAGQIRQGGFLLITARSFREFGNQSRANRKDL